jgi:HD-GYP domain-containing protein (c-di-GMP phosphodiesterase class II)
MNNDEVSGQHPSVAHILSALSHALDLVEGQPRGHATRTAYIALRLAEEMKFSDEQRRELLYACLLKDSGCSNNSARIHKMFGGDDLITKQRVKLIDWSSTLESVKFAYVNMERGGTVVSKLRRMAAALGTPEATMNDLTRARCTRGAQIAQRLGFNERVSRAIRDVDEHWDGKGAAEHLKGEDIHVYARIVNIAQTLEVFASTFGVPTAFSMIRMRSGRWFQPELVRAASSFESDAMLWKKHASHLGGSHDPLWAEDWIADATSADVDEICNAFAEIIDAKSDVTSSHSSRVTDYALEIGKQFNFDKDRLSTLRRASLLHDIGKLGVSNAILDKPDRLTNEEFESVKEHPKFSYQILARVQGFERIAEIASAHHEKLNGFGYWRGLSGAEIDLDMRILAVADIFDALSAERPYRGAMPMEKVWKILDEEAVTALDPDCVSAAKKLDCKSSPKIQATLI